MEKTCGHLSLESKERILPISDIVARVLTWKTSGLSVVLTNGCFDLLHVGHVTFLERARKLGDRLVVGINTDRAVKILKGPSRPVNTELHRAQVIASLRAVDAVVLVDDSRVDELLALVRPTKWAKGGDYTLETLDRQEIAAATLASSDIVLIPTVQGVSTTHTLRQIRNPSVLENKCKS